MALYETILLKYIALLPCLDLCLIIQESSDLSNRRILSHIVFIEMQ
jgi:hypothetical protein